MLGTEVNVVIRFCWCIVTPLAMLVCIPSFSLSLSQLKIPSFSFCLSPCLSLSLSLFDFLSQAAFILTLTNYQPPTYEGYTYPVHARVIGFLLSLVPLIPLPITAVYYFRRVDGTFLQVG